MLRDRFIAHHSATVQGFRWRSREITRIEGFSDAVFGFAVTLLVVSLEVPKTSTELLEMMHGFGAFLVTFTMLVGVWYGQYLYFRRYGLEDRFTVIANLVLLFVVLFFVYPLKFLFGLMVTSGPALDAKVMGPHGLEPAVLPEHQPIIYLIFGAGYTALFVIFALLYRHALAKAADLDLNELEVYETRYSIQRQICAAVIGVVYLGLGGILHLLRNTPHPNKLLLKSLLAIDMVLLVSAAVAMLIFARRRKAFVKQWHAEHPEEETAPAHKV